MCLFPVLLSQHASTRQMSPFAILMPINVLTGCPVICSPRACYTLHLVVVNPDFTKSRIALLERVLNDWERRGLELTEIFSPDVHPLSVGQVIHHNPCTMGKSRCKNRPENTPACPRRVDTTSRPTPPVVPPRWARKKAPDAGKTSEAQGEGR